MLFDTASLYFRAFHGLPTTLRSADGRPVNAVRGLLDFLARFIAEYRPAEVACCWDQAWRPAWRVALLASYKAHRVAPDSGGAEQVPAELAGQVELIAEVLAAAGLPVVGAADAEADDVIGTLAAAATGPVDIVTGDRDLFQLVRAEPPTRVLYTSRGVANHELVDVAWLQARYGIPPEGYVAFAVLRGDASDGLPGVPGIGEKTAARLVADHGDLAGVLSAAGAGVLAPALTARLSAAVDYLAAAQEVVTVRPDLALGNPDLRLPTVPAQPQRYADLAAQLQLGGSAERLLAAMATAGG